MGFVLAGGRSSRMGTDKAFVPFGGRTLLARALEALGQACDEVAIVGDPARFSPYGAVVADIFPHCGPLGGIHAALSRSTAPRNIMLAVDMPLVSRKLLAFLLAEAAGEGVLATVPRVGGRLQPLCAVYRLEFAAVAERALRAGHYKVDAAFAFDTVRIVEEETLAAAGFSRRSFVNLNTPEDRLLAEPPPG